MAEMAILTATVLYVEDEETDVFLMRRAFAKAKLEGCIQTVPDGRAALDYITGTGAYTDRTAFPLPRVVLLDLNLPELHGFDVLKWIRAHPVHKVLPVVIFSSSPREEDRARTRELGADEYWHKPNASEGFGKVVQELQNRWLTN